MNRKLVSRFIIGLALAPSALSLVWAARPQTHSSGLPRSQKNESRRVIDKLEDKWRDALLKGDAPVLESLMADEYVGITSNGTLQTKDSYLAAVRSGVMHIATYQILERKVHFYGITAVVNSLVEVEGTGIEGKISGKYRYTRIWVRDAQGVWRVVNYEASHLGPPRETK